MIKRPIAVVLIFILAFPWSVIAQSAGEQSVLANPTERSVQVNADISDLEQFLAETTLEDLDFSQARISFAGPAAFLLRDAKIGEQRFSFLLRMNALGDWVVSEVLTQNDQSLPTDLLLDFARFEVTPQGTLLIDGILWEGQAYSTELSISPNNTLGLPDFLRTGTFIGTSLERALAEGDLVPAEQVVRIQLERDQALEEISRLGTQIQRLQEIQIQQEEALVDLEGQVHELVGERERLLRDLMEARAQLARLTEQNEDLAAQLADALAQAEAADGELTIARAENEELREDLLALEAQLAMEGAIDQQPEEQRQIDPPQDTAPQPTPPQQTPTAQVDDQILTRITTLENQVQALNSRIGQLERQAAEAERLLQHQVDMARQGHTISDDQLPEIQADVLELVRTIRELEQANAVLTQQKVDIERDLRRVFAWEGYLAVVRSEFTRTRLQGFTGSVPAMGTWNTLDSGRRIRQTDQSQFFARLDLPLVQNNEALLYRFTGQSTGPGWAGFGIHIFADNSTRPRGYGFGDSLLIWFTRDPQVYGTNQTYLELYRSRDDVNMERVLHAAIEERISGPLDIEILYEPEQDFITITVNGEEKIRYKTWFQVRTGVQVALRSLGTAEFSRLEVRSR